MTPKEITRDTLPDLAKGKGHKFDHGHAMFLSGGPGRSGAARLAARGALRIGAGLVTVACPNSAIYENAAHLTSIMVRPIGGSAGFAELMEDSRVTALCLGPGMGLTKITADIVKISCELDRPMVLDADALSRFQRAPEALFDLVHENVVMTPHGGEFRRLFPDLADELAKAAENLPLKCEVTCAAAKRAGCLVLFKGENTVIANPSGACSVHSATGTRAAPWLATAGAGDVLAGFITGLMARGMPPIQAAEAASWVHVECALGFGPGLISEDLPEMLPNVLQQLASSAR